jgi:hypothetical protein
MSAVRGSYSFTSGGAGEVTPFAPTRARAQTVQAERVQNSASVQPDPAQAVHDSAQTEAAQVDADLASELIASGVTTQARGDCDRGAGSKP